MNKKEKIKACYDSLSNKLSTNCFIMRIEDIDKEILEAYDNGVIDIEEVRDLGYEIGRLSILESGEV